MERVRTHPWITFLFVVILLVIASVTWEQIDSARPLLGSRHSVTDWGVFATFAGTALTLVGIVVALDQLGSVKISADAARDAANDTRREIAERMSLGEYGIAAELCAKATGFISSENYDAANEVMLRLRRSVGDAKTLVPLDDRELAVEMQDIVGEVVSIELATFQMSRGRRGRAIATNLPDRLHRLEVRLRATYDSQRLRTLVEERS